MSAEAPYGAASTSQSPLKGRLVVATPALGDPNFKRTVVLVVEHGDEGAVGLVLNRPSDTEVVEPLPGWQRLAADPAVVFVGGPVAPNAAICLARGSLRSRPDGWDPLLGPVGTLDLDRDPDEIGAGIEEVRVFAGYAGWGPGQLEAEIASSAWWVIDALPDDILSADPGELWYRVLGRQLGPLRLFANFPPDPTLN